MTENERKINLSTFEKGSVGLGAMIPGLTNISSVGSKLTCRGGKPTLTNTEHLNKSFDIRQVSSLSKTNNRIADLIKGHVLTPLRYDPILNPIPNYV
jgi:hypothetical protein